MVKLKDDYLRIWRHGRHMIQTQSENEAHVAAPRITRWQQCLCNGIE